MKKKKANLPNNDNYVVFKRNLNGEELRVLIEVPKSIPESQKHYYAMDLIKELKTIYVKKPLNSTFLEEEERRFVELAGDKKPLTINVTTELYDELHKLIAEENLNLDSTGEYLLRFALTHTCEPGRPYVH